MKIQTSKTRIFVLAMLLSAVVLVFESIAHYSSVEANMRRLFSSVPQLNGRIHHAVQESIHLRMISKTNLPRFKAIADRKGLRYRLLGNRFEINGKTFIVTNAPQSIASRIRFLDNGSIARANMGPIEDAMIDFSQMYAGTAALSRRAGEAMASLRESKASVYLGADSIRSQSWAAEGINAVSVDLGYRLKNLNTASNWFIHEAGHHADFLQGRYVMNRRELLSKFGDHHPDAVTKANEFYDEMRQNYRAFGNMDLAYEWTVRNYHDFGSAGASPLRKMIEAARILKKHNLLP